jgi:hypothetical protein
LESFQGRCGAETAVTPSTIRSNNSSQQRNDVITKLLNDELIPSIISFVSLEVGSLVRVRYYAEDC